MNLNRSCIVITPKETVRRDDKLLEKSLSAESEEQIPPAVREMARAYIEDAGEKAKQIISNARLEAERIREAAREEGFEQGLEEGRRQAADELAQSREHVSKVLSGVEAYRKDLYNMLESDVLALSMDVAEKVVSIVLKRDDQVFKDIVKKAILSVRHADDFSLYVSKADYERYFQDGTQWLFDEAQGVSVDVTADGSLPEGSCIIEAGSETVDAGIPMQLKKIRRYLGEQED